MDVDVSQLAVASGSEYLIEVKLRGLLVLNKQAHKSIAEKLPNNYPIEAIDLKPNRVELILLEVLGAHLVEK